MRVAYNLLRSRSDAEDVLHDVFLGLPEALRKYEESGRFDAWLRTVAARAALTRMRTSARRKEDRIDDASAVPDSTRTRQSHERIEERVAIGDAMDRLPDSLRTVFVLKVIEGYSHSEISKLLSISEGASEVRLVRAMKELRMLLGGQS
jgi:RNA polymerase sigma-70 factor (ECF subfamily)